MTFKDVLLLLLFLFFTSACGNRSTGKLDQSTNLAKNTYTNPLLPEGSDPSAVFHNGKYYYIHDLNQFLNGVQASKAVDDATKTQYIGEVRYIRAWLYFCMGRTLGGVPIVGDQLFNYTPGMDITTLQVPRSKEAELYDYVISECEAAASMIKPVFANKYPMEEGLVLSGNIENISKKRLEGATVQAIIRQDTLQRFAIGTLDNEKHFQISNISFNDTTDVVLSVTDKVGHTYPLKLDPQIAFPAVKEGPFILSEDSLYYTRWKMAELPNSPHNIDKQVFNLGEVTVTARKRDEIEKRRLYGDGFVKTSVEVPENSGMVRLVMII